MEIIQLGDTILRSKALPLSREEILSQEIQELIQAMKETMRKAPGVGLAAPQVGIARQILVVEDRIEYHAQLSSQQLKERGRVEVPFHVLINPMIHFVGDGPATEFFEGCLSIPGWLGIVPRAKEICVEGLNEKGQSVMIHAKDWYARILQHEIDHLNGILFVDKVLTRTLTTTSNYNKLWKDLAIDQVKECLSLLS